MPNLTITITASILDEFIAHFAEKYKVPATAAGARQAAIMIFKAELREARRNAIVATAEQTIPDSDGIT